MATKLQKARRVPPVPAWAQSEDIRPGMTYLRLTDIISGAIRGGVITAGSRLPTQRELAVALRLNVGTISRAYRRLQDDGLIDARPRHGSFVRMSPPSLDAGQTRVNLQTFACLPARFAEEFSGILSDLAKDLTAIRAIEGYKLQGAMGEHREAAAEWMRGDDWTPDPQQTLLVENTTNALFTLMLTLTDPGDVVAVEALTVPGVLTAAKVLNRRLVGIAMDEHGAIPEALAALCREHKPKLVILTPNLQNPTCAPMPVERRRAVADVLSNAGVLLIEDDLFRDLIPADEQAPRFASMLPDSTLVVTSTSKTVAQVIRLGMIVAPPSLFPSIATAVQAQSLFPPTLTADLFVRLQRAGALPRLKDSFREQFAERELLARELLGEYGLRSWPFAPFAWLPFPDSQQAQRFYLNAMQSGVAVRFSEEFAVPGANAEAGVRINIGAERDTEQFRGALQVLRDLLATQHPVLDVAP